MQAKGRKGASRAGASAGVPSIASQVSLDFQRFIFQFHLGCSDKGSYFQELERLQKEKDRLDRREKEQKGEIDRSGHLAQFVFTPSAILHHLFKYHIFISEFFLFALSLPCSDFVYENSGQNGILIPPTRPRIKDDLGSRQDAPPPSRPATSGGDDGQGGESGPKKKKKQKVRRLSESGHFVGNPSAQKQLASCTW